MVFSRRMPAKGLYLHFSLDRIRNLSATKQSFKMPEIDEEDFFGNSFGIMWSNEPPKEVSIKVYGEQVDYIKSAPLHHSQKEISQAKDGTSLFSYNLHIPMTLCRNYFRMKKHTSLATWLNLKSNENNIYRRCLNTTLKGFEKFRRV